MNAPSVSLGAWAEEVRAAALGVFGRFASELAEPGIDGGLLWLVFNVLAGPATREELNDAASFVQAPRELIDRAVSGGWIEAVDGRYAPTERLRALSARVMAVSQRVNLAWRESITQGASSAQLDEALQVLVGNRL